MHEILQKLSRLASAAVIASLPIAALAGGHGVPSVEIPFDDLEWAPFAEGVPVDVAVLWGSMETGPVGFLIRVSPGFAAPVHTHSANYHAVVLQGQHQHWQADQNRDEVPLLGPGSYFAQAADAPHGDANVTDDVVISFV